ncbi:gp100 [Erwinia phage vB_EamP-S6]|uniref:Gp100 n=1 Tax=Erwinia phage vB_EamP-S6 TaxID=1051675 RepID=G0YQJ2_9CAUD|nr:gp100 [Erwinia phage vB_EamP-S6]AEJ81619.1 gp100 [Erwinia phage vB_EamP-S6]
MLRVTSLLLTGVDHNTLTLRFSLGDCQTSFALCLQVSTSSIKLFGQHGYAVVFSAAVCSQLSDGNLVLRFLLRQAGLHFTVGLSHCLLNGCSDCIFLAVFGSSQVVTQGIQFAWFDGHQTACFQQIAQHLVFVVQHFDAQVSFGFSQLLVVVAFNLRQLILTETNFLSDLLRGVGQSGQLTDGFSQGGRGRQHCFGRTFSNGYEIFNFRHD